MPRKINSLFKPTAPDPEAAADPAGQDPTTPEEQTAAAPGTEPASPSISAVSNDSQAADPGGSKASKQPGKYYEPMIPEVAAAVKEAEKAARKLNRPKKMKPQSVYLNESELSYVMEIAKAYNENKHSVLQYAVKEMIYQWKHGKKPRKNNIGKLDKR